MKRMIVGACALAVTVTPGTAGDEAVLPHGLPGSTWPMIVAQASQQAPAENRSGAVGALNLPPDYRRRVALYLLPDFIRNGRGRPEFFEGQPGYSLSGPTMSMCIQFPIPRKPILFERTEGTQTRSYTILLQRDPVQGKLALKTRGGDDFQSCSGQLKPFVELEQLAQAVKACQARGGADCAMLGQPAGRR